MVKWGKNQSGSQKFKCISCRRSWTDKRAKTTTYFHKKIFHEWISGKQELEYFSNKYSVTTRTLHNWFKGFWAESIQPQNLSISNQIIIIDGFVLEEGTVLLLARTKEKIISGRFVVRESYATWKAFFEQLRGHPEVIVCDGQKGMLKAIKELFPRVIIQRCQFHILQRNKQLLTQNPETIPAIEFKKLVEIIPSIRTREQLKHWLEIYLNWRKKYDEYLKEKTYYEFDTQYQYKNFTNGKRKWFYTHKKLRGAVYQIKTALPNLFCYLNNRNIPNTTNHIEGGINSQISLLLRLHRGLPIEKRKYLVTYFLSKKQ